MITAGARHPFGVWQLAPQYWPAGSVAEVLTLMVPTFADVGVPLNVSVDALNVSHEGKRRAVG
jgi:hypothetical protein